LHDGETQCRDCRDVQPPGDLLEVEGANPFRVRAYRNAARQVGGMSRSMADLIAEGKDLSELPDIGEDLAEKIEFIVRTGRLPLLEEVEKRTRRRSAIS
jgi:DNA polymerase (family X)